MHSCLRNLAAASSLLALVLGGAACKGPAPTESADSTAGVTAIELQQCGKDTDCKGDRICDAGQCVAPGANTATPTPTAKADPYICGAGETLLFQCTTTNAKRITLCDAGNTLRYTFGKPGAEAPEMNLSIERGKASTSQGMLAQTIDLPNGNTTYSVFWGADRMSEEHAVEAGVLVQVGDRQVATVKCKEDSVQSFMEDVDLPAAY